MLEISTNRLNLPEINKDLFAMRRRIGGRCQRSVSRCLWAHGEATTAMIVAWYYRQPAETRRLTLGYRAISARRR
jgi:hypothetical protein